VIDLTDRDGGVRQLPDNFRDLAASRRDPAPAASPDGLRVGLARLPPQLFALPVPRRKATTVPSLTSPPSPQLLGGAATDRVHWLELPACQTGVGEVRRMMGEKLRTWRLPQEVCQDAVLILSELVTNAIRHTSSARIHCCLGLTADGLVHLEVHDQEITPRSLPPCDPGPDDERGRGLLLVQYIAEKWGADRSSFSGGNVVWAALTSTSSGFGAARGGP
jgi:anti-sigma regulatory factor (Ser/Thr protein kinase)